MRAKYLILNFLFVGLLAGAPFSVSAKDVPSLRPPLASALTIDGVLDEDAWAAGVAMPVAPVVVPDPTVDGATRTITPTLRAVVHNGQLVLGATCAEPPGTGCGLIVFVAPADATSSQDAWTLSFRPLNPRTNRYTVRTPQGVTYAACPIVGGVSVAKPDAWSLELRVPLAELGKNATLRIAAAVCTRTPTQVAASPADAAWKGPDAWLLLEAPEGGWSNADVPSEEDVAKIARTEVERREAWDTFLVASHRTDRPGTTVDDPALWESLRAVSTLRPELTPVVETLAGDLYERVGAFALARDAYDKTLAMAPGWVEARFGRDVRLRVRETLQTPQADGAPTNYDAALAAVAAARQDADAWNTLGLDFAEGILLARKGEALKAQPILKRLASRVPGDAWLTSAHRRIDGAIKSAMFESQQRTKKDVAANLPRVQLKTSRGDITVELFEKHAPNAVNQFLWLVEHGFYDDAKVSDAVPYSHVALGDVEGPGYAIRVEQSKRPAQRGAIAFPLASRDTRAAGARFVLVTGNALEQETLAAFGVVIAGQAIADALRPDDTIKTATVLRKTEGRTYRPVAVDGKQAPKPK